jgi:hypothetical protein
MLSGELLFVLVVFGDEVEVVDGDEGGEGVREEADGVGFAEDEVEQEEGGAEKRHVPEGAGHDGAAGFAGGDQLDDPPAGEHERADVADDFPAVNGDAEEVEKFGVHEELSVSERLGVFWRRGRVYTSGEWGWFVTVVL